jgi:hypothetical protein
MADPFADIPTKDQAKSSDPFGDIPSKPVKEVEYSPAEPLAMPSFAEGALPSYKDIGKAALLSTKQQFPMMEKGFQATPQQMYLNFIRGGAKTAGQALAKPTAEEAKIQKQLETLPPGEAAMGMALSPYGEAAALKAVGPAVKGAQALGKGLGLDKLSAIPESFKLGKKAKEQTEALRRQLSKGAGAEAEAAAGKATAAQERAGIAETAEQKATRQQEAALRGLPGVKTAKEAGEFRPIPQTANEIGTRIRASVDRIFNDLKAKREANAQKLKADAFDYALSQEKAGKKVEDTAAYKSAMTEIKNSLTNPDTKLTVASVDSIKNQLQQVKRALDPRYVDEAGIVRGKPVSFEGLETLRRFLRDRANGLPAEGFDAISQQQAGKLAKSVENIMSEFSDGRINKFIDQYRKDSEPMRVFNTKVGKAFLDQELLGKGVNYNIVAAQDIPGKVFRSPESFQVLIDALGGNRQLANAEANRYFASQLEGVKTFDRAKEFISKNRTMLQETGTLRDVERYADTLRTMEKRAGAAKEISEKAQLTTEQQQRLVDKYRTLESNLLVARTPDQVTSLGESYAKGLLDDKIINQAEYRALRNEINEIEKTIKDATQLKDAVKRAAYKAAKYGAGGTAAMYGVGKLMGD